jgi:hypothetical protein
MNAVHRVYQLRRHTRSVGSLAHRTFEHITHPEFAPDLFDVDRLAFLGEARIAGDHEKPADAGERGDDLLDHF